MTSSFTTNKSIEKPANGDYPGTWSTPVNNDWDIIDRAFGGVTSLTATGVTGTQILTLAEYRAPIIVIGGALAGTAVLNYQIPSGIGGFWYIYNNTTGSTTYTINLISGGGGTTVTLAQGFMTACISDGVNIRRADNAPGSGSTGVTSVSFGTTGLLPSTGTTGAVVATGTLNVANGGTGATTLASGSVLLGAGTSAVTTVAPSSAGNVLTSNGSTWISQAPSGGGGSGNFSANDGSVSAPSIYFTSDIDTGIYRIASNQFGIAAGGVRVGWFTTGTGSLAMGQSALASITSGLSNLGIGQNAGTLITSSSGNSCIGASSGSAITGGGNTSIGGGSMSSSSFTLSGSTNTGIGYNSYATILASSNFTGANTVCIGFNANPSTGSVSNEITLGNSSITTLRCQVTTITSLSDARDKANIVGLNAGLDFVNALNPVRFTWNMRPTKGPDGEDIQGRVGDEDTGFIAQELKAAQEATGVVIPGLVYEINPESIEAGYGKLLPVLVKAIQELSAKVDALEAQIAST